MNNVIHTMPLIRLILAFIPVIAVVLIIWKWGLDYKISLYAIARMLIQLSLVGYLLVFIFEYDSAWIVAVVLVVMLIVSSWIALHSMGIPRRTLYLKSFCSILLGGGLILVLITQGVLNLEPWYSPSYMIPLAGMIFANAMNGVSLAGERLGAEINRNVTYEKARVIALKSSLIPITNSLFAVGLVSLPGMMTGQILAGVSPFIAARYQIMVMCMIFSSVGISSAIFLVLVKSDFSRQQGTD